MNTIVQDSRSDKERMFDAGIEWIVARQLMPLEDKILMLRAHILALFDEREPC